MNALTQRQEEILKYLEMFTAKSGYPPTIREIRSAFGFRSNRSVVDHLKALERKGYIKRDRHSSRAIEIINHVGGSEEMLKCPVAGTIAAGELSLAIEDIRAHVSVDKELFVEVPDFFLEVDGDSMTGDGILPGDLVAVKKVTECENGAIIVAVVGGEATVKRFYLKDDSVVLEPSNAEHTAIVLEGSEAAEFRIAGRVVGIIRRLKS
jgi:repressor LexA